MNWLLDPNKVDPDKLVDSRYQESFWERHRSPLLRAEVVYWVLSAAYLLWFWLGVDPGAEVSLWMLVTTLVAMGGVILLPAQLALMGLRRVSDWLSPPDFQP